MNNPIKDYILICEFCQVSGPVLKFSYPKIDEIVGTIPVQLLKTNYEVQPSFQIQEDIISIQKVYSSQDQIFYAYAHRFFLFDSQARGFTRSICLAYLTNNYDKIMMNLNQFLFKFSNISNLLKLDNFALFLKRFKTQNLDLDFTLNRANENKEDNSKFIQDWSKETMRIFSIIFENIPKNVIDILLKIYKNQNEKISHLFETENFNSLENKLKLKMVFDILFQDYNPKRHQFVKQDEFLPNIETIFHSHFYQKAINNLIIPLLSNFSLTKISRLFDFDLSSLSKSNYLFFHVGGIPILNFYQFNEFINNNDLIYIRSLDSIENIFLNDSNLNNYLEALLSIEKQKNENENQNEKQNFRSNNLTFNDLFEFKKLKPLIDSLSTTEITNIIRYLDGYLENLLFSLLIGRPVAIIGDAKNKEKIFCIIRFLAIFVPGNQEFQYWIELPLKFVDLESIKLCGMSKKIGISQEIKEFITILDYEENSLVSPFYPPSSSSKKNIITKLMRIKKLSSDKDLLLFFIYQTFYEFIVKIYIHFCFMQIQQFSQVGNFVQKFTKEKFSEIYDSELLLHSDTEFDFKNFGFVEEDLLIIKNFYRIITSQIYTKKIEKNKDKGEMVSNSREHE
ncbi:hypothetical protein M0811_01268 [Anaeramoeba ignava]|uniref:UDENN FLCN/SMCR8-type domain-containing protein n=1 Tax=Anaeramoeba ignava TaxID=1746090 RepID=A0A9Q0RB14_ANAIG|nr:hypothetical protein M0811_01268 [Anaeramoeba ignava]